MKIEEIKDFLRNKPGYIKEGGARLKKHLSRKGYNVTVTECKIALREMRQEQSNPLINKDTEAKILLYDIEVSYGLARVWRPGYKIRVGYNDFEIQPKIICISWKWHNSNEVFTVDWGVEKDDKELLKTFIKELNKADFIVAHNGDKFDLPWIRTRALYHRLPMLPKYKSVDTLKIARYTHKFPSNRLDDLANYLGLGRKIKTDMDLWIDTVSKGDYKALNKMVEYCEQDVFVLEEVYDILSSMTLNTIHAGTLNGKDKQTSPYTGSTNFKMIKKTSTKAGTVKYLMQCLDTNKYFEMSKTNYEKYLTLNT